MHQTSLNQTIQKTDFLNLNTRMGKRRMKSRQNIVKEYISAWEDSEEDMCYDRASEREWEHQLNESMRIAAEIKRDIEKFQERCSMYFNKENICHAHHNECCRQCLKWIEREQSAREEFPDTSSW